MPSAADVARMLDGGPRLWLASGPERTTPPEVGVVLDTSGSTGRPMPVELSRAQLRAAAAATAAQLGWSATWHLALPAHYIAGFMVLVRGVLGQGLRVARPDLSAIQLASGRNVLCIVPTQLRRALEQGIDLAGFDAVLVGGAPLDGTLRRRAEAADVTIVETYGMSETCGGVVYDGVPLPGVEVTMVGERIRLHGAMVIGGSFLTSDRGVWRDGRLQVLGRVDDVVITGGLKVDLAVVRRAVQALDPESWVLAVDDAEWGQRLVLFAVHGDLDRWRGELAETLPKHALPRQLVLVDRLPRTAGGKPDRRSLLECLPT